MDTLSFTFFPVPDDTALTLAPWIILIWAVVGFTVSISQTVRLELTSA